MPGHCPICQRAAAAERAANAHSPFCSARCKAIDLGRWLSGAYALPVRDEVPSEADLAQASAPRGDA